MAPALRPLLLLSIVGPGIALAHSSDPTAAPTATQDSNAASPWFREVGKDVGLDWSHAADRTPAHRFPEIMGGGVALLDYDNDGDLDIYLVQGGVLVPVPPAEGEAPAPRPGNKLFRNDAKDGVMSFTDVTEEAGVGDTGYGMGAACGDFDRDGDVDLYVTNVGGNVLYVNNGNGTFTDKSKALKVGDVRWGTSAAFLDANGDGRLDLYVVNNLAWSDAIETECVNYYGEPDYCSPNNYNSPSTDVLYTFGRLGFTDSTLRAGVEAAFGNGLGVTVGDYDLDGDADIYVANDATSNVLWQNNGKGIFEDVALTGGCAVSGSGTPEAGMGVQFLDLDADGDLDLYMTHLRREKNTFYRNRNGRFRDMSNVIGTSGTSLEFTGFGMGFQDFNLDGVLDLFVANGAVQAWKEDERYSPKDAYAEPNHLFNGTAKGSRVTFNLMNGSGVHAESTIGTSRGAAFGDLEGDGDVDIVVVDLDARVKLLENVAPRAVKQSWVGFRTVSGTKNALVPGATVFIDGAAEGTNQVRQADPAYSYLSSNDPRVHFGLGGAEVAKNVTVRWPDGTLENFGEFAGGSYHDLKKGAAPKTD